MTRTGFTAIILAVCLAGSALAQAADGALRSLILVVDQERLFSESRLGASALAEIEDAAISLAAENRTIESELLEEERALTEQRAVLPSAEFTELASTFDAKVQRLREEQDAKSRALARARDEARQAFFGDVGDILTAIARERGAVVMLERRQVFLSVDSIDVTDEAIERVNLALGAEGAQD